MPFFTKTLNGSISELDRHGYGKIKTPDGKVVHFTLSQLKTPTGANVGSLSMSQLLLGEKVQTAAKDAGDGVLIAESVTVVEGDNRWRQIIPAG